jgi:hypothetical protein
MNGKNYLKRKEEPMPMKLPKTYKNERATSKYPKYTETKGFWSHSISFCGLKNYFLLRPVMFFFGNCNLSSSLE